MYMYVCGYKFMCYIYIMCSYISRAIYSETWGNMQGHGGTQIDDRTICHHRNLIRLDQFRPWIIPSRVSLAAVPSEYRVLICSKKDEYLKKLNISYQEYKIHQKLKWKEKTQKKAENWLSTISMQNLCMSLLQKKNRFFKPVFSQQGKVTLILLKRHDLVLRYHRNAGLK